MNELLISPLINTDIQLIISSPKAKIRKNNFNAFPEKFLLTKGADIINIRLIIRINGSIKLIPLIFKFIRTL